MEDAITDLENKWDIAIEEGFEPGRTRKGFKNLWIWDKEDIRKRIERGWGHVKLEDDTGTATGARGGIAGLKKGGRTKYAFGRGPVLPELLETQEQLPISDILGETGTQVDEQVDYEGPGRGIEGIATEGIERHTASSRIGDLMRLLEEAMSKNDFDKANQIRSDLYREYGIQMKKGGRAGYNAGGDVNAGLDKLSNTKYGKPFKGLEISQQKDILALMKEVMDKAFGADKAQGGRIGYDEGSKDYAQHRKNVNANWLIMDNVDSVSEIIGIPTAILQDHSAWTSKKLKDNKFETMGEYDEWYDRKGYNTSPIYEYFKYMPLEEKEEIISTLKKNARDRDYKLKDTMGVLKEEMASGGRIKKAPGGLMNLGGMEKDYRQTGGFVPIGKKEKADDVPARLSKNEFVMTADAVRAAGGGNINKGAQRMYNTMKQLEGKRA